MCFRGKIRCSIKYRALTDTYPLGVSCILLGHKRSLGGILPFCWVRWPCGWRLLPMTWFSWSLKDLTRIVILLPCQFFSHFVLTVHLHRLQNLSWNSIRGSKNLSPLCVLRAGVIFQFASWSEGFLVVSSFLEFFSPWFDSLSTQLAKFIWNPYLLSDLGPDKAQTCLSIWGFCHLGWQNIDS